MRDHPIPIDLTSISPEAVPAIVPGSQSTNLVQLGQYMKEGKGFDGMPARNARAGGYDHKEWFTKYKKMGCPVNWYLSYEVLDYSKYSIVDCITKSVLLFQHLFRRPPLTDEEVMRCYDGSTILFECVRPFEDRLDELFESTFNNGRVPNSIRREAMARRNRRHGEELVRLNKQLGKIVVNNSTEYTEDDTNLSIISDDTSPTINDRHYAVSRTVTKSTFNSLIDRGANGGLAGEDMRLIEYDNDRTIDVQGIDNHEIPQLRLGKFGAVARSKQGEVLLIFCQYAHIQRGKSIHSALQLEDNGVKVDDRPARLGGKQQLKTLQGYVLPLDFKRGLAYLKLRRYRDDEYLCLPHVYMTRDTPWFPARYDSDAKDPTRGGGDETIDMWPGFDEVGELIEASATERKRYRHGHLWSNGHHQSSSFIPQVPAILSQLQKLSPNLLNRSADINAHIHHPVGDDTRIQGYGEAREGGVDYDSKRKYLLNMPSEVVRHTYDATTRYYRQISSPTHIKQRYRTNYPACNVSRRNEAVATDTIFADTTAWGGWTAMQFYIGRVSRFVSGHECHSDGDFVHTLRDEIRLRGAMDKITSDRAQAEISNKVADILRSYCIKDWQSEPDHQWQNFAERAYQDIKRYTNWILNTSGAPPEAWVLAIKYVIYHWNRIARAVLGWRTPYEALTGQTPDISSMLCFQFWEKVLITNYQTKNKKGFPSQSNELMVRFAGYGESVGPYGTFKVWNEDTQELLFRSEVKKIRTEADRNARVMPRDESDVPQVVQLRDSGNSMSIEFDPSDLINRSYLGHEEEDGTLLRKRITELVEEYEGQLEKDPKRVKYRSVTDATGFEEVVEHSDICQFIEEQEQRNDGTWKFQTILGDRTVKGRGKRGKNKHEILLEWESGERTWEPIRTLWPTQKYLLAEYAQENGKLDAWNSKSMPIKKIAKQNKLMVRMVNKAKLESYKNNTTYMFGYEVPRNHEQAMELDRKNGNSKWADSEKIETDQLLEYEVFEDRGHRSIAKAPEGYKNITLHFVYAVKHDGRHKSRAVAGGHLTETPTESVYSGVVSLQGVRLVVFLAELNNLKLWQTDVGNAYLEAETKEKVYIVAGPEFGEKLKGHMLVVKKALYGLKTSGLRWHERFADVLSDMGFTSCPPEPDIWMRDRGDHYEYIAVYCDDLTIASRDPEAITTELVNVYKFKLKGTGEINYLLGCDYYRDKGGFLCMRPRKYIDKMISTYQRLFDEKPVERYLAPLEPNDNPELDSSELLDLEGIKIYQSLVGACQWVIQLGRFDIAVHVMSLSSFRAAPRRGHLDRMKRIYGYLMKFKTGTIRIRTAIPDFSDLAYEEHDWSHSPYAGAKEQLPSDLPTPKGKPVRLFSYADANLYHNKMNGKAVTAVLHFINKTPFDWYTRTQSVVNTATFGAEATAARTAIEQMRSRKMTLMYLGVPIVGPSILFGDNESVVNTTSRPHGKLHKRHLMLSYHYMREAFATGEYVYAFVNGKDNPSDILSKHWSHASVWPLIQPILFYAGDTIDLFEKDRKYCDDNE